MATELSRLASITDYAMVMGISTNIEAWPRSVKEGYFRWAQHQMGEFNPVGMKTQIVSEIASVSTGADFVVVRNQFDEAASDWSGRSTVDRIILENEGFGPGDYSGGYTGEFDRVYWGPDSGKVIRPPPARLAVNTRPKKKGGWVDYENQVPEQNFTEEIIGQENPFAEWGGAI
jgi:hypothetical protein